MAITHLQANEVVDLKPLGDQIKHTKTTAFVKSQDIELIHLVLSQGMSLPPHKVKGEITIQCIEGKLDVVVDGKSHIVVAGQLLFLMRDAMHSVLAIEDSSALVTVTLR